MIEGIFIIIGGVSFENEVSIDYSLIEFSLGKLSDKVWCGVFSMHLKHLLFDRPWLNDHDDAYC